MKKSKTQTARLIVQIASFTLSSSFLLLVIIGGTYVIHEACPYAVVCFGLSGGNFFSLGKLVMAEAIIFGLLNLFVVIFLGRLFCSWLCPLGSLQEWIYSKRSKKYKVNHRAPFHVDRKFAFIKYLVLLLTVVLAVLGLGYIFMQACPFFALSQLPNLAIWGLLLGIAVTIASFYGDRLWCRFLCPYAALMNVFQWLGELAGICRKKVKRDLQYCTEFGVCELFCPMNIYITEKEYVVNRNCIHCNLCHHYCPGPNIISKEFRCPK